ncbi:type 4a pilus biogenesis protein PilO [Kineococcus radiotolerans]|uniref:Pilus assembly protein PilO n=1 Tax=Kineococcus radiotolerans (strain ATCC BAA-149 / DSM 14245 / SRS30216) TaxID=266940 RepID=A6WCE2_KINRD|nr:type 4a pilus biogenesis protein PilO [Kineococcus radiotolerans]ABS04481.1 hypothetical protein Krad_3017 [Kineococcus radiotolerans SRS30216 = ATCC BAA-149]
MSTSRNTVLIAGTGALALLVLVASYFLLVAPKRAEAADLATQRVYAKEKNAGIEQQTRQLQSQFESIGDKRAQLAAIRSTLPAAADVPALLRQLEGYANTAGVVLTGVTPGTPEVFGSATDAATAQASGPQVVDIPLTITTSGSFSQTELFIKSTQADMQRFFLVENLALNAGDASTSGVVSTTLTGKIFVLQADAVTPSESTTQSAGTTAVPTGASAQ